MYIGMTLKTHGNRVLVSVRPIVGLLDDMVDFDLHTAEAVAYTATAMAGHQEFLNVFYLEFPHLSCDQAFQLRSLLNP